MTHHKKSKDHIINLIKGIRKKYYLVSCDFYVKKESTMHKNLKEDCHNTKGHKS